MWSLRSAGCPERSRWVEAQVKLYTDPCGSVCGIPKDQHQTEEHPWVPSTPPLDAEALVYALENRLVATTDDGWEVVDDIIERYESNRLSKGRYP